MVMHHFSGSFTAFHRHQIWFEIVITAGPWSILNYSVFHEETYIIVLSMQTAIAVLFTKALINIINSTPFDTFYAFFGAGNGDRVVTVI